jgi:cell division protease FtsH
VLLVDEVDAIGTRLADKGEHKDYWTSVITCMLELLDGTEGRAGVLVLATTNDPGALDPALVRSGRLDRMLEIRRPDPAALEGILRHHLGGDLADDDLAQAARLALGGNGADCARWVRTARQSARQDERSMTPADLLAAIGTATFTPEVERMVAVHEAGHAVVTVVLRPGSVMDVRVGIGIGPAGTVQAKQDTRSTREAVHGQLLELLAGRAAEEVVLGRYSGGSGGSAGSDLAIATCLAVALETSLGLGTFGPMWQGQPTPDTVGTLLALRPALAARVQAYLEAVHGEAVELVRRHHKAVSAVADVLVAMRSLTGSEVEALVAAHSEQLAGGAVP